MKEMLFTTLLLLNVYLAYSRVSDDEIKQISSEIWASDENRLDEKDVIHTVDGTKLFAYVNEEKFTKTHNLLKSFFDNYIPQTGQVEQVDAIEMKEEEEFLDAILATKPVMILHKWLVQNGLASPDQDGFKSELRQYWFLMYTRSKGPMDSSAFEHVFNGEIKKNSVSGFHNWLFAYYQEKAGNFQYGSYLGPCQNQGIKLSFNWLNYNKPISSFLIRTSPEVEIALFTLCFLTRAGSPCIVELSGLKQTITTYRMDGTNKTIGTSYVEC